MSTNDPPQGPYGPGAWPPQEPPSDPTVPYPLGGQTPSYGGGGWPPQQPPQQPPYGQPPAPPQPGGWSEQPTTQWQGQQPGGWPDQGPGTRPQGLYGAQPGGPPSGPPYYPPPSGGSSSGGSKATLWIVGGAVALVLVLVVAVVGVIAVRNSGDPGGGPTTIGGRKVAKASTNVLWTLPEPPGSDLKGANKLTGLWLSEDSIVRATVVGLTAYDIETGKQQWTKPVPSGTSVCQVSPKVADGLGAIIYGTTLSSGAKCDQLMLIDAKSGDQRWTIGLRQSGDRIRDFGDSFTSVSIASDVVVAQNSDAIRGYSISSGTRKWGLVPKGGTTSSCRPINSLAEGESAIIVLDCASSRGSVSLVNSITGKITWTHGTIATEGDPLFMDPISIQPLVLASKSIGGASQILVLDELTGALKKQISSSIGGNSALDFGNDGSRIDGQQYQRFAVQDGKVYAATEGASGARRNEIVGVDLNTGEASWTTPSAADTRETIVTADDKGVLTLNAGGFDKLPRLVRYDAATGKAKNGDTLPDSVRNKLFGLRAFVVGKKIVLVSVRSGPDQPPITVLG